MRGAYNNAEVLREVALAGGGVALLPDWLVNDDIGSGDLTSLFESFVINPNDASSAISALYLPNIVAPNASMRLSISSANCSGLKAWPSADRLIAVFACLIHDVTNSFRRVARQIPEI